jgi:hypothetical protein
MENCMTVLSCLPRERQDYGHRFVANDNGAARPARDVAPGECWAFADHRTMASVIAAEAGR